MKLFAPLFFTLFLVNSGYAYADSKHQTAPGAATIKKTKKTSVGKTSVDEWTASHLGSSAEPVTKKKPSMPKPAAIKKDGAGVQVQKN